jgi:PAS domain S-box-containing protein
MTEPLRRSELFEQAVDCMPDALAAVDCDGVVFFVNRRTCELTGYSADELLGRSFTDLLRPPELDATAAQLHRTIRTGIPVSSFKTALHRKNGAAHPVSLALHPLMEAGRVAGVIGMAEDVTSRERAERQYRLLESVVLNAREAIVITEAAPLDPPGPRIQYVNRAFTELTSYEIEEVVGLTPRLLQGSDTERAVLDDVHDALRRRTPIDVELVNYRKDRSEYRARISIVPLSGHFVAFQTDVTERLRQGPAREKSRDDENNRRENEHLTRLLPGREPATIRLRQQIVEAAQSRRLPVVVLGERGVGKALVAREVHRLSSRAAGPFVTVDCSAIPAALFESEMFGHERGAFTGATALKRGLFQQANGGTLFLDEIGELSSEQQAKLLVAIQDRAIRRVGGTAAIPVDVRITAATNRDLDRMAAEGGFRHDLYDRIRGFVIDVPPLRERGADLDRYVGVFVERWSDEEGKTVAGVEAAVLEAFRRYPWPGNVRELELVIGRMVARTRGDRLTADLLPPEIVDARPQSASNASSGEDSADPAASARREYSKPAIVEALERNHGIVRRTARELGIARNTLYRLMAKFGIRQ